MPKTLLVTSFNHSLYEAYAHRFLDTYRGELDLCIVSEDVLPEMRGIKTLRLRAHQNFVNTNRWRTVTGYKDDAVRFCYKPYSIWTARQYIKGEDGCDYSGLLWLDGDTVFHKAISEQWVQDNLHTDGVMSYMGRVNNHSECGVLYFNLNQHYTEVYINQVIELYNTNEIYNLKETHDSFVFDWCREHMVRMALAYGDKRGPQRFRNLAEHITEPVRGGHIQSVLYGELFDHTKGKRKQLGKSPENKH